jgi:hypothetical protein
MRAANITVDIYECSVELHIFNTENEIKDFAISLCKKYKLDSSIIVDASGWTIKGLNKYFILLHNYQICNTFFHELFHTTNRICNDRGIHNEEAKCWLHGYLGEKLIKFINT